MITISIAPNLVRFGGDKFRSDKRYVRSTAGTRQFAVITGASMNLGGLVFVGSSNRSTYWKYSVDGYVVVTPTTHTFTATVTPVTTE